MPSAVVFQRFPRAFGRRQKGAAAIEFALVFVLFFAIFYGTVSYSLPLLMMQSFNNAAAEAVRQAVGLVPGQADYQQEASDVIDQQLSWMPNSTRDLVAVVITAPGADGVMSVRISYPYNAHPLVPFLVIPGIGRVPSLPDDLVATASIKLNN
ncbi:TadE/TadG family type IV pilus assembly protein [Pseudomonas sp. M30-35]|uniref:TadE/TadG family type IV pilus assembly protein n=1 Tax=Pseudomonas sp. M30-35 TaxID=1981174 RepID=UPI000B3D0EF1|nr:TadE/TadG family type IV pilus assembly protein [Pseudomonas sp. M30-35]ARU90780.1 pilus assembly protein TadE [Pseudomonas sp. M30-35]